MPTSSHQSRIRVLEMAKRDLGRIPDPDLFEVAFGNHAPAVRENFPGPQQLVTATPAALSASGVPEKIGRVFAAALELARRARLAPIPDRVSSPDDAFAHLAPLLSESTVEMVAAVAIGGSGQVIEAFRVCEGGLDRARVDSRVLLGRLLRLGAVSFVLGHNHPSGDVSPSQNDFATTERLSEAANLLDLGFLDHLVISGDRWESMRRLGALGNTKHAFELPGAAG